MVVYYSIVKEKAFMRTCLLFLFVILFLFSSQAIVRADMTSEALEAYRVQGLEAQQKGFFDDALAYYTKALSLDRKSVV